MSDFKTNSQYHKLKLGINSTNYGNKETNVSASVGPVSVDVVKSGQYKAGSIYYDVINNANGNVGIGATADNFGGKQIGVRGSFNF